jgi:hypothetical protein
LPCAGVIHRIITRRICIVACNKSDSRSR